MQDDPTTSPSTERRKEPRRQLNPRRLNFPGEGIAHSDASGDESAQRSVASSSGGTVPWDWNDMPVFSDVLQAIQEKNLPHVPRQWRVWHDQQQHIIRTTKVEGDDSTPLRLTPAGVMDAKIRADRRRAFQMGVCALLIVAVGVSTPLVATSLVGTLGVMVYAWAWLAAVYVCGVVAISTGYFLQWLYDTIVVCQQRYREEAEAISLSLQEDPAWRHDRAEEDDKLGIKHRQVNTPVQASCQSVLHDQVLRTQILKYLLRKLDQEVTLDAIDVCYRTACDKLEALYSVWCADLGLDAISSDVRMEQHGVFLSAYLEVHDLKEDGLIPCKQAAILVVLLVNAMKDDVQYQPIQHPIFMMRLSILKQALIRFHIALGAQTLPEDQETLISFAYARLLNMPDLHSGSFSNDLTTIINHILNNRHAASDPDFSIEPSGDSSEYTSFTELKRTKDLSSPQNSNAPHTGKQPSFFSKWFVKKTQPLSEHAWRVQQFARCVEQFISEVDLNAPVVREAGGLHHVRLLKNPKTPVQGSGAQYENNPYVQRTRRDQVFLPDSQNVAVVSRVQMFRKKLDHLFGALSNAQTWWLMSEVVDQVCVETTAGEIYQIDVLRTLIYLAYAVQITQGDSRTDCLRYAWPVERLPQGPPKTSRRFRLPWHFYRDWETWRKLRRQWSSRGVDFTEVYLKQSVKVADRHIESPYQVVDQKLGSEDVQKSYGTGVHLSLESMYQDDKKNSYSRFWRLWCIWMLVLAIGLGVGLSFVPLPVIVGTMGAILSQDMACLLVGSGVMSALLLGPFAYTMFVKPWLKSRVKYRYAPSEHREQSEKDWWADRQSCTLDTKYRVMGQLAPGPASKAVAESQALEEGSHKIRHAWYAFKQAYQDDKQRLDWRALTAFWVLGVLSAVGVSALLYHLALPVLVGTLGVTLVKQLFALMVGLVVVSHILVGHCCYLAVLKPRLKSRSRSAYRALGRSRGQKWAHYFIRVADTPEEVFVAHCRSLVSSLSGAHACGTQYTLYMQPSDLLAHLVFYRLMWVLPTDVERVAVLDVLIGQLQWIVGADWQSHDGAKMIIQSLHVLCYRVRCMEYVRREGACLMRPDLDAILTHLEQSTLHASVMFQEAQTSVIQVAPVITDAPEHPSLRGSKATVGEALIENAQHFSAIPSLRGRETTVAIHAR